MGINIVEVYLIIEGSIVGNNKGTGSLTGTNTYYSFGGATDKWGLSLTPSQINASNFGTSSVYLGTGGVTNYYSNYLNATNFGFNIPTNATIDGVLVEIKGYTDGSYCYIDHVRITIYYTEASVSSSVTHTSDGLNWIVCEQ
jgi:hypothetical protein